MEQNYALLQVSLASPSVHLASPAQNAREHTLLIEQAASAKSSILVFPELSLSGATCADLFFQPALTDAVEYAAVKLAAASAAAPGLLIVAGAPLRQAGKLYNAGVLFLNGRILGAVSKTFLTAAECRYFSVLPVGDTVAVNWADQSFHLGQQVFTLPWGRDTLKLGLEIGEEASALFAPGQHLAAAGAEILCNVAAANSLVSKNRQRETFVAQNSARLRAACLYANAGTGESSTDLVFGSQLLVAENGKLVAKTDTDYSPDSQLLHSYIDLGAVRYARRRDSVYAAPACTNSLPEVFIKAVDLSLNASCPAASLRPVSRYPFVPEDIRERQIRSEEVLQIQAAGLARRLRQIQAKSMVLGISGGLDSTLALLVCLRAAKMTGLSAESILGITMPGFGTSQHTYSNATGLMEELGISQKEISIVSAVLQHFSDIGQDPDKHDVTYENAQARERTQILMDTANQTGGLVIGAGDLSELALGWCTYNGDHMSMYSVNGNVPKTLIRSLISHEAAAYRAAGRASLADILESIVGTPVSPELLPTDSEGQIAQITENTTGPYTLNDFFLYHFLSRGADPRKILWLAKAAFAAGAAGAAGTAGAAGAAGADGAAFAAGAADAADAAGAAGADGAAGSAGAAGTSSAADAAGADERYTAEEILHWLKKFGRRFFTQQYKRSCMPDGPKIGSIGLSPRGDLLMPSDADASLWQSQLE